MTVQTERIDRSYFARRPHPRRLQRDRHAGAALGRARARHRPNGVLRGHQPGGTVHLKMHRSERDHALLKAVDFSAALDVPGVLRVLTHKDVPANWYTILRLIGVEPNDEPVLPEDRVLYRGEPIVAVVATSEQAALSGAAAVQGRVRGPPAVFDVEEALADGAPAIKPHGTNYFVYEGHHCRRIRFGDVEARLRAGRPRLRVALPVGADRACTDRDDRLHRRAAAGRPAAHPLRHAGVLLHPRQHRPDPRDAVQQAAARSAAPWAADSAARSTSSWSRSPASPLWRPASP